MFRSFSLLETVAAYSSRSKRLFMLGYYIPLGENVKQNKTGKVGAFPDVSQ